MLVTPSSAFAVTAANVGTTGRVGSGELHRPAVSQPTHREAAASRPAATSTSSTMPRGSASTSRPAPPRGARRRGSVTAAGAGTARAVAGRDVPAGIGRLLAKLDARDRAQLVMLAHRAGLGG